MLLLLSQNWLKQTYRSKFLSNKTRSRPFSWPAILSSTSLVFSTSFSPLSDGVGVLAKEPLGLGLRCNALRPIFGDLIGEGVWLRLCKDDGAWLWLILLKAYWLGGEDMDPIGLEGVLVTGDRWGWVRNVEGDAGGVLVSLGEGAWSECVAVRCLFGCLGTLKYNPSLA